MRLAKQFGPLLIIGAGHMGGALVEGWRRTRALEASDFIIVDLAPGETAQRACEAGARLNPPAGAYSEARTVLLALKPQVWRSATEALTSQLDPEATLISVMAGVSSAALIEQFGNRPVVRAMPTTATAVGKGSTGIWSASAEFTNQIAELFAPLGSVAQLEVEDQIHAVTAASGSAPAYLYAVVEALEAAGVAVGLGPQTARALARQALIGAAALLESSGESAETLRRQVTSPRGTTEAALAVLTGDGALDDLLGRTVAAAAARSRELGGER